MTLSKRSMQAARRSAHYRHVAGDMPVMLPFSAPVVTYAEDLMRECGGDLVAARAVASGRAKTYLLRGLLDSAEVNAECCALFDLWRIFGRTSTVQGGLL